LKRVMSHRWEKGSHKDDHRDGSATGKDKCSNIATKIHIQAKEGKKIESPVLKAHEKGVQHPAPKKDVGCTKGNITRGARN